MSVNHSEGGRMIQLPFGSVAVRLTIGFALGQHLRQINFRFPDEVRFPQVLRVTRQTHELAALDVHDSLLFLWRWGRWGAIP